MVTNICAKFNCDRFCIEEASCFENLMTVGLTIRKEQEVKQQRHRDLGPIPDQKIIHSFNLNQTT